MKPTAAKTVVFITGAFVSHNGWNHWKSYFEEKGYKTLNPAWPHKDASAQELRNRQPNDNALANLTLSELIDHYALIVKSLPEKPILVGHSLGGLISQVLLNRGLVAGAAVIHPLAPLGIIPYEWSFLRSAGKALGLFTSLSKTYLMSLSDWQYAFTNGMTAEEQRQSYEENTIPESKRVARGGLTTAARVNFNKQHAPLLIISGTADNIIPATLNKRNFKAYKQNGSITEYKEFTGKNHYVLALPSWKEEADYILNWINKYADKMEF